MSSDSETKPPTIARRGLIFVLSSPSGAGKTTLAKRLLAAEENIQLSVSATTRPPRSNEQDGVDYHFLDIAAFDRLRDAGELLEWAEVFGNFYGTPKASVDELLQAGHDVLLDIDWQGARQIRNHANSDTVSVFILPPSGKALEQRLIGRGQDSSEIIQQRMKRATEEISHWDEYDHVVINTDLDDCLASIRSVLAAARLSRQRQMGLANFAKQLQIDLG